MNYSNFTTDQITSPIYKEIAQKLLSLAKDEDTRSKMVRHIIRRWIR